MKSFKDCPGCGEAFETGFVHDLALPFVRAEKLERFIFLNENLSRAPAWRRVLPARAKYFRCYICRACELYLVDYSSTLDHAEAKDLARELTLGR